MYLFIKNDFFVLSELCSSAPETPMVLTPRMTSRDRLKKHMITSYDDSGDNYGATSNRVVLLAGGVEPFLAPCELSTESDDNSGQTVSSSSTNYVYFKAPPHENVWQFLWKKRPKKPKHFVELISNFNNLSDFSHSSTFQTRVYFFSKPSKNVTNWKKNYRVYRDCIYSLYVYSWLRFFSLCVCASAWSLTLIYAGRKVFSIHFGGLTLQKTWFWTFPPQFTHPKIIYHTM